jgi:hypothetical protein
MAIPGSGLGLSIVRTIVTNHHGDLSITSAQDEGTTVTVRIPLQGRALPPQPARLDAAEVKGASPLPQPSPEHG